MFCEIRIFFYVTHWKCRLVIENSINLPLHHLEDAGLDSFFAIIMIAVSGV